MVRRGFRLCGGDQRAVKTDEVCDRPLETFGSPLSYFWGIVSFFEPKVHWINTRALYAVVTNSIARKGVQRVEDPLVGSRGNAPWVPPINTRALYAVVPNSIARKGVQRVEDPLVGSRGNAPWVPPINTRALYAVVPNSIARKGQGRNSLAESRGRASGVTSSSISAVL